MANCDTCGNRDCSSHQWMGNDGHCDEWNEIVRTKNSNDTRLIAAAPEMYEALAKMQEAFDYIRETAWFMDANFASISQMNEAQTYANAVLAKASGESSHEA